MSALPLLLTQAGCLHLYPCVKRQLIQPLLLVLLTCHLHAVRQLGQSCMQLLSAAP
jgi:hypothetical protein